jgi:outer membrane receptor protein involved in Fe transport
MGPLLKRRGILCLQALLGISLAASLALGQAQSDQDLMWLNIEDLARVKVYSASRHLEDVREAPSSVSIITAEEIRRYGAEFPLDLDLIDHIEVVRGPGSSLFGTNALFGVINVITRRPGAESTVEVVGDTSSFLGRTGRVSVTASKGSLSALVSGTLYRNAGASPLFFPEFVSPETNNGYAGNMDGSRWEFSASCYNALNRRWFSPMGPNDPEAEIQQDGRTYRFKLSYRLREHGKRSDK